MPLPYRRVRTAMTVRPAESAVRIQVLTRLAGVVRDAERGQTVAQGAAGISVSLVSGAGGRGGCPQGCLARSWINPYDRIVGTAALMRKCCTPSAGFGCDTPLNTHEGRLPATA